MARSNYRLSHITVANFRGFTSPQTIEVGGRHLFIFGPNGFGKSSVVEAIRWCLLGSSGQHEIELRNTFFPSEISKVALELTGGAKFDRQLRPGQTESGRTIRNAEDKIVRQTDVIPKLTQLGTPTGTQVIFAAQQSSGRRNPKIDDFRDVLYCYLGLDGIYDLLKNLGKLQDERQNELREMGRRLDEFCQGVRGSLEASQERKDRLLLEPPWEDGSIPTRRETLEKTTKYLRELLRLADEKSPHDLPVSEMFDYLKDLSKTLLENTNEGLDGQLEDLTSRHSDIEKARTDLLRADQTLIDLQQRLNEEQEALSALLENRDIDSLRGELARLERAESERGMRIEIVRLAQDFINRFDTDSCPACSQPWLLAEGQDPASVPETPQTVTVLEELRGRVRRAEASQNILSDLNRQMEEQRGSQSEANEAIAAIAKELNLDTAMPADDLSELVKERIESIQGQIDDATGQYERRNEAIRRLYEEHRFHQWQDRIAELERILTVDVENARRAFADYTALLNSANNVARILLEALDDAIDESIVGLSENISDVFQKLTNHPSYDQIVVRKGDPNFDRFEAGQLDLRVMSSRRPNESYPTNVLNGQAAKALELVPYFVFSELRQEAMEFDLLLIDDPSESFDTSHIEHLMNVLRSVGMHSQLIMASHEEERVRPVMEDLFLPDDRCVVRVTDFDPDKGPTLVYD